MNEAIPAIGVVANEAFLLVQFSPEFKDNPAAEMKRQCRESSYWRPFLRERFEGRVQPGDVSSVYAIDSCVLAWADADIASWQTDEQVDADRYADDMERNRG